ncbi:hypothetical protein CCACVL1_06898 [Corchorus capsularis]|uniref:Uncharacterized protein n=1 Tax=Corchorus capsularis TaxID=210143 RepID=A0A1R3JBR7_COCAP|nr:hypothetical protein CCACVL1_06898 [Corchorus capsularis]
MEIVPGCQWVPNPVRNPIPRPDGDGDGEWSSRLGPDPEI